VLGVTGCGKSLWLKQQLSGPFARARILVWDFKREYIGGLRAHSCAELVAIAAKAKGAFYIAFAPSMDAKIRDREFDIFCRLALQVRDVTVIVEELKFVTKANWAPAAWSMLTMTGRDLGVHVIATSQRPASIDKDFLGNATEIHTGRLVYPEDVQATAKAMGVEPARIERLQDLQWIEVDKRSGKSRAGTVEIA
jgi:hypothetical protein